ncbi:GMP synthase glutamine-hydrolyzing protein [Myxococcus hansupus]|uniref:GMP synthase glutamine-hydrolyzing protein n=1 Tax=Pseudomyxococcus hansupus TaxID=1297742 RepID=A0A0H4WS18_9BACT|nr:glutamine amidotransferase [Myxococcus hansupus]AKQ64373.1 GMP synthase glutamine-hydrolyzing protein [Myxococcus hansupus]
MRQPSAVKNVLLLKAGDAADSVRVSIGDYDRWFLQTIGLSGYRFDVVPVHKGAPLPTRADAYDAVMMTGSPLSVTALEPWMERAADFMVEAGERGTPVLGVCFGQQLLAHAYGGHVSRNPQGRETGSVQVTLTEAGRKDALFDGVPERFTAQATHEDIVSQVPEGAQVLASNANTAAQALAFRPKVRGVQFHPEAGVDTLRAVIEARREKLDQAAVARGATPGEHVRQLLAGLTPSPSGRQILLNFLERFS